MIDAQRYRDASMAWLRVSDLILLTPGWQRSAGCRAEWSKWRGLSHATPTGLTSGVFDAEVHGPEDLAPWLSAVAGHLGRTPRVYVAGPYLTGVDGPYDETLFRFAVHLVLFGDPAATRAMAADGRGGNGEKLATNILNGLDWCRRVLDAGGYPYCPWADALLVIASPSEEATS